MRSEVIHAFPTRGRSLASETAMILRSAGSPEVRRSSPVDRLTPVRALSHVFPHGGAAAGLHPWRGTHVALSLLGAATCARGSAFCLDGPGPWSWYPVVRQRAAHLPCQSRTSSREGLRTPSLSFDLRGTLFFSASTQESGRELWRSDGTAAGTVLVKDIYPGPESGLLEPDEDTGLAVEPMVALGEVLLFTAEDGAHGRELWKSDGTAAGTVLVKDIWPGQLSSHPSKPLRRGRGALLHGG